MDLGGPGGEAAAKPGPYRVFRQLAGPQAPSQAWDAQPTQTPLPRRNRPCERRERSDGVRAQSPLLLGMDPQLHPQQESGRAGTVPSADWHQALTREAPCSGRLGSRPLSSPHRSGMGGCSAPDPPSPGDLIPASPNRPGPSLPRGWLARHASTLPALPACSPDAPPTRPAGRAHAIPSARQRAGPHRWAWAYQ